jgi:hypothetical protein
MTTLTREFSFERDLEKLTKEEDNKIQCYFHYLSECTLINEVENEKQNNT